MNNRSMVKRVNQLAVQFSFTALIVSSAISLCFAEGGGGGGGVGGNGASGPEPQSWSFLLMGCMILASIAMYRKFKSQKD